MNIHLIKLKKNFTTLIKSALEKSIGHFIFFNPYLSANKRFDWEFDKSSNSPLSALEIEVKFIFCQKICWSLKYKKHNQYLKIHHITKGENIEESHVYSLGYDVFKRVDYVPVRGGDGMIHHSSVP